MKRMIGVILSLALAGGAFAQTVDMTVFADGLQAFTDQLAPALPVNSTIGTAWSDAYIGGFPHLGAGAAVGVTTVPAAFVNDLLSVLSIDPASIPGFDYVAAYGLPIPAAVASARLGGLLLPFDVGVKFGAIPPQVDMTQVLPAGMGLSYTLAGADLRLALLNEKKSFIDLVVGVGADYLDGKVSLPLNIGTQDLTFNAPDDPANLAGTWSNHTLSLSDPSLYLAWQTVSADLTVQVSKNLLIFTPYVGAGVTLGKPAVQSGLKATMTLDGAAISDAQYETLRAQLAAADYPVPADFASLKDGYIFEAAIDQAMDYRAFGGLSVNLLILRLDLGASYNFVGKNLGGTVGVRLQL
jgi:hypothetical protein